MLIVVLIYANIILLEHMRLCSDPSGATEWNPEIMQLDVI
jgi:hypothetical protein